MIIRDLSTALSTASSIWGLSSPFSSIDMRKVPDTIEGMATAMAIPSCTWAGSSMGEQAPVKGEAMGSSPIRSTMQWRRMRVKPIALRDAIIHVVAYIDVIINTH